MHGYRLVQVSVPPPPSRLVDAGGRPYSPPPAPVAPPGHALLPYRRGSVQLLRPGITKGGDSAGDTYQALLDTLPDLDESQRLIPPAWAAAITSAAPEAATPFMAPRQSQLRQELAPGVQAPTVSEDLHQDAWGGREPVLVSVPLAKE